MAISKGATVGFFRKKEQNEISVEISLPIAKAKSPETPKPPETPTPKQEESPYMACSVCGSVYDKYMLKEVQLVVVNKKASHSDEQIIMGTEEDAWAVTVWVSRHNKNGVRILERFYCDGCFGALEKRLKKTQCRSKKHNDAP